MMTCNIGDLDVRRAKGAEQGLTPEREVAAAMV
jgi:hypothetical protein